MAGRNNKKPEQPKGSVEDAGMALKQSQQEAANGEDQGGGKTEDQGINGKPGEEQQGTGGAEGGQLGEQGAGEEKAPSPEEQQEAANGEGAGPKMVDLSDEEPGEGVSIPVPNPSQCEEFAKVLAGSPEHMEAFRLTLKMAEDMIVENSKGPKKTIGELEAESYNRLVAKYGKDFVTARKGTNKGYYSRKAWNAMSNKRGWVEVTKTMPEVARPAAEGTK